MTVQYDGAALFQSMAINQQTAFDRIRLYGDPDSLGLPSDCAAPNPANYLGQYHPIPINEAGPPFVSNPFNATISADGIVALFRLFQAGTDICTCQGTVSMAGGGGDMILDNTTVSSGDVVTITLTFASVTATP